MLRTTKSFVAAAACAAVVCLAAVMVLERAPQDGLKTLSALRRGVLLEDRLLLESPDRFTGRTQTLDLVTRMNGYSPNGISYSEGQMPLGLGAASGICDHGYCPQESDDIQINPREVPTSPYAVTWTGFNWEDMDDDINVFQPNPCLSAHLAGLDEESEDSAAIACMHEQTATRPEGDADIWGMPSRH